MKNKTIIYFLYSLTLFGLVVNKLQAQSVDSLGNYVYTHYYPLGNLQAIYSYTADGKRASTWEVYTEDGTLSNQINYDSIGYYKKYDEKGNLLVDIPLVAGKISEFRNENIHLLFMQGKESGPAEYISKDTLQMFFKEGKPSGIWTLKQNFTFWELHFTNKRDCQCRIYNEKGKLMLKGVIDLTWKPSGDWIVYEHSEKAYPYSHIVKMKPKEYVKFLNIMNEIASKLSEIPINLFDKNSFFRDLDKLEL